MTIKPRFFATPAGFREWLARHHADTAALWVGYYKKGSGRPSITWPESVAEALCFGWIDGIRKSIDADRYMIRFTPRKPGSIWSNINIKRAEALIAETRMRPAGFKAYEARKRYKSGIYSYEQRSVDLPDQYGQLLKKNKAAWTFFEAQRPSFQKMVWWWIISAKKEETRLKRLERLITYAAQGQQPPEFVALRAKKSRR